MISHRLALLLALAAPGCGSEDTSTPTGGRDPDRALLGGDTTIHDDGQNAFGTPAKNATEEHRDRFVVGNSFFKQNWVTAPASTEGRDGLGPLFNARSCSSCHSDDGRGRPPEPGEDIVGLLFRLTNADDYGGQLQPYGILGVPGEALPVIEYAEKSGSYADGSWELLVPTYSFAAPAYGPMPEGMLVSPRVAPHVIGLGLLESVTEETLLALADPDDLDGDGISGRVSYVPDIETGGSSVGRFGWKANQPTVRQQTAGAFLGDMGITSSLHPDQDCTSVELECNDSIIGGTPEIEEKQLLDVILYSRLLAVPARRDIDDPVVQRGEDLFDSLGCASCHVKELATGGSDLPEVADQTIRPFTDLLLHDMGPELADGRPDNDASGVEWRTPPLWGIGLIQTVNGHTRLLHDGRARNAEEAILFHGGEAQASRDAFVARKSSEREALLRFLESL
jgi:CxxC motif-containing protein (DUF1111 family)